MDTHVVRRLILPFVATGILIAAGTDPTPLGAQDARLLVFSKTAGFRHASIPDGIAAVDGLAGRLGVRVDFTEDAGWFTADRLSGYRAVVFLSTTGDVLDDAQQAAFEGFIRAGGGYVGIHAATDTEYDWPWYGKLAGAYFNGHPRVQPASLDIVDPTHPATRGLPRRWDRTDEWYDFRSVNPDVHVLITIDERTYEGGKTGPDHPMAWSHEFDGGRVFYTAGGHTSESFVEPLFLDHLAGGISWVLAR